MRCCYLHSRRVFINLYRASDDRGARAIGRLAATHQPIVAVRRAKRTNKHVKQQRARLLTRDHARRLNRFIRGNTRAATVLVFPCNVVNLATVRSRHTQKKQPDRLIDRDIHIHHSPMDKCIASGPFVFQ